MSGPLLVEEMSEAFRHLSGQGHVDASTHLLGSLMWLCADRPEQVREAIAEAAEFGRGTDLGRAS